MKSWIWSHLNVSTSTAPAGSKFQASACRQLPSRRIKGKMSVHLQYEHERLQLL